MTCDLAAYVQPAAEQSQVVLSAAVPVRQSPPDAGQQPVGEHPDEEFEQRFILIRKPRELAVGDGEIVSHREHVHEGHADGAIGAVDLRQNLDARPRNGENADDLAGLQAWAGCSGKYGLRNSQSSGCAIRQPAELPGTRFRNAVFPDGQMPPLANRRSFHHSPGSGRPASPIRLP